MSTRASLEGLFFVSPYIVGILAFFLYPLILLLVLSVSDLESVVGLKMHFNGIENFREVFFGDVQFVPLLLATLKDTAIKVPLTIIFSLLIAILINKDIRGRDFFRVVFFLPFLLGNGYVMKQLLDQDVSGRAIQSASTFFMPASVMEYLGPTFSSIVSGFFGVIVVIFWGCGVQILLFLSGLQSISTSYYEAARVESANEWDCFWHITLPMISPIILLCIIYSLVDSFMNINNTVLQYTNTLAFTNFKFDYSATVSLVYSLCLLLIIGLVFLFMRRATQNTESKPNKKGGR